MIEPTESEDLSELDRFCEAMLTIRAEINEIADGQIEVEHSPLRHAPHTLADLVGEWNRPYDRQRAVFPVAALARDKYFSPVGRIDSAYGDRNLMCTCEPLESYQTEMLAGSAAKP
jgi:glycine dehydrogenase